jgi:uncharacterized protein with HEPN domain
MSKKRPIHFLLEDILISIADIEQFTHGLSFEGFVADRKTNYAVIRGFEIIGEAVNRLPDDFKEANPQIDWFRIRGFRNRLVHDYVEIDYELVWEIRNDDLPTLKLEIQRLFDALPK